MAKQLQAIDFSAPIGSIAAYGAQIQAIPMLSAAEESALALRWHAQQDVAAAKQLVLAHLRFVLRIARGYTGYGLAEADLIQEGNIGLMKAVKRFNPTLGVRLATFAAYWIKSEIHEFILRNWRLVRVATTKAQRKLFFNLRRMKKCLNWLTDDEAQGIAEDLGVSKKQVHEMEQRLYAHDVFLDTPHDATESAGAALPAPVSECQVHADPANSLLAENEKQYNAMHLQQALLQLPERERTIIKARHLAEKKTTLTALAQRFNISAERVRQLEQAGLQQLHTTLTA